ncbi:hypothetical protein [Tepidibacter hydrothermalis]|uniref:Uncharacterized protein n=1 Tax=Tepidibacter hydrothermalis TaxID=3036126 RepID=A0ABY8EG41_9FIRM|nr:hypothetical protein [Tepidibacter hydrothermalis]WFD09718.1 hypothetical protein P4S50_15170 [Tepidibacter hydrothermalis]
MKINSCDSIKYLIEDIEELLEGIFLSGAGSLNENIVNDVKALANRSAEVGLSFAAEKLNNIYDELNKKYHSIQFDYSKLVKEYYLLNGYIDIIKKARFELSSFR